MPRPFWLLRVVLLSNQVTELYSFSSRRCDSVSLLSIIIIISTILIVIVIILVFRHCILHSLLETLVVWLVHGDSSPCNSWLCGSMENNIVPIDKLNLFVQIALIPTLKIALILNPLTLLLLFLSYCVPSAVENMNLLLGIYRILVIVLLHIENHRLGSGNRCTISANPNY